MLAEREGAAGSSRAPSGPASDAPRCPRRPGRGSGRGGRALGRQRPLPEGGSGGHGAAAGPRPPPAAPGRAALPQPQPQGESNNKLEMCWLLRVVINHKDFGVAQFIMAFKLLLDVVYISVYAPYRLYINRIYNILTVSIYKQYCDKCIVGLSIVFK